MSNVDKSKTPFEEPPVEWSALLIIFLITMKRGIFFYASGGCRAVGGKTSGMIRIMPKTLGRISLMPDNNAPNIVRVMPCGFSHDAGRGAFHKLLLPAPSFCGGPNENN